MGGRGLLSPLSLQTGLPAELPPSAVQCLLPPTRTFLLVTWLKFPTQRLNLPPLSFPGHMGVYASLNPRLLKPKSCVVPSSAFSNPLGCPVLVVQVIS